MKISAALNFSASRPIPISHNNEAQIIRKYWQFRCCQICVVRLSAATGKLASQMRKCRGLETFPQT